MTVHSITTSPFADQRPGTSGLRKRTTVFQQTHYLENFVQALLEDETVRRPDIFKIDAAERGPQVTHSVDEFIRVVGVHFEID